jgi:hypothetical protein
MKEYQEVTPVIERLDTSFELDHLRSSYNNIRFGVLPAQVVVIDSKYQANLPGLCHDFYGDQTYWRAVLAFNGLNDPISDIAVGARIGLPDPTSLQAYMARANETLVEPLIV